MKQILLSLAVMAIAAPAMAQVNDTRIEQRQQNQERRIEQGVNSGTLTPREENRLRRGEQRIENTQNRAEADGKLTAAERARIERQQNVESRRIARQKHDLQHTTPAQ